MLNYISASFTYITQDQYFWYAMAFTTIIGQFISAAIYDGETKEIKKFLIGLGAYASLIVMTTSARVWPILLSGREIQHNGQPLAGIETIVIVTVFYLLGMVIGVFTTRHAHRRGGDK